MDLREIDREFGAALKMARLDHNLSQDELASRVAEFGYEMSQATVGKIERGERKVTVGEAEAFAAALNRPLSVLVGGKDAITEAMIFERLLILRNEIKEAIGAHLMGQRLAALLMDSRVKDPSPLYVDLIGDAVLEGLDEIVLEAQNDQAAENVALRARHAFHGETETTHDGEGLLGKFDTKFGDAVPKVLGGRGLDVMLGRGINLIQTEDADGNDQAV